ncbi:MAG: hypothetical protein KF690_07395 [Bacteroidetes bacterium]|nr:hypothetical protein [Bacteroidota bacterium]
MNRTRKKTYYSVLMVCCLLILALPFWVVRRYGLAPDWSILSVLKFLLAAGAGLGGGLLLVSGGGWAISALSKAPVGALAAAGILGTGALAAAVVIPAPKAGGARQAIRFADRNLLQEPQKDSTDKPPTKALPEPQGMSSPENPAEEPVTDSQETRKEEQNANERTEQPAAASTGEAIPGEIPATAKKDMPGARTAPEKTQPAKADVTYKKIELGLGYQYSIWIQENEIADVRSLPQLSADMNPLGGWWQTGKGKPHLILASRERQQLFPDRAEREGAVARRPVQLGRAKAICFVTPHEEGGYLTEYWIYYGDGFQLAKVYDPRVFSTVKDALASKPAFKVP